MSQPRKAIVSLLGPKIREMRRSRPDLPWGDLSLILQQWAELDSAPHPLPLFDSARPAGVFPDVADYHSKT